MCISSSVGPITAKESGSALRMIINHNGIKNKNYWRNGMPYFSFGDIYSSSVDNLEDVLSTERGRLEESANNPSSHPTNK